MAKEFGERPAPEEMFGQLPDWAIKYFIKNGIIQITPLLDNWENKVDPTTYDFHLGPKLQVLKPSDIPIDPQVGVTEEDYEEVDLLSGSYILNHNGFVVARTLETLVIPDYIEARLDGKSSLARIGVGAHVTSARFDPGWNKPPVLELTNPGPRPVILRAGMPVCAFAFNKLMWPVEKPYNGRYKDGAVHSLVHQEFHK